MNVVESLTAAKYVATPDQIAQLARFNLKSLEGSESVRGVYLKCLIAGVQKDLTESVTELEQDKVLQQVHERYYGAVLKAVTTREIKDSAKLPVEERRVRAQERNRRSNFARSAKSTLLNFIRADGDVQTLDADKITKGELHAFAVSMAVPRMPAKPLSQRVVERLGDFEELVRELADADKPRAVQALEQSMERLSVLMIELGATYTDRGEIAVRDHKIWRTPAGTFWPIIKGQIGAAAH